MVTFLLDKEPQVTQHTQKNPWVFREHHHNAVSMAPPRSRLIIPLADGVATDAFLPRVHKKPCRAVPDDGCFLPKDDSKRLFQPFRPHLIPHASLRAAPYPLGSPPPDNNTYSPLVIGIPRRRPVHLYNFTCTPLPHTYVRRRDPSAFGRLCWLSSRLASSPQTQQDSIGHFKSSFLDLKKRQDATAFHWPLSITIP